MVGLQDKKVSEGAVPTYCSLYPSYYLFLRTQGVKKEFSYDRVLSCFHLYLFQPFSFFAFSRCFFCFFSPSACPARFMIMVYSLNSSLGGGRGDCGVFYNVVTNAPFVGRVEKGVETSVYITEFAVIRNLG